MTTIDEVDVLLNECGDDAALRLSVLRIQIRCWNAKTDANIPIGKAGEEKLYERLEAYLDQRYVEAVAESIGSRAKKRPRSGKGNDHARKKQRATSSERKKAEEKKQSGDKQKSVASKGNEQSRRGTKRKQAASGTKPKTEKKDKKAKTANKAKR